MIAICILLILATNAEVLESSKDPQQTQNVTTLYPVSNKTDLYTRTNCINESESHSVKKKSKTDATTWKLEAAFGETNLDKEKDGNTTKAGEEAREIKNDSKNFKPSQPLGNFVDEEALSPPATESYEPFTPVFKQPDSSFASIPKKHYYVTYEHAPKEIQPETPLSYTKFPYKFEKANYHHQAQPPDILESKPTAEIPVRVPGIYKNIYSHRFSEPNTNPGLYKFPEAHGTADVHEYPMRVNENTNVYGFPQSHGSAEVHGYPEVHGSSEVHGLSGPSGKPGSYGAPPTFGLPAGGLYKLPYPFKEEPVVVNAGEYGWEHNEEVVQTHVKERVNPLKNLLHFITAFLPVGLIISALTPSVITIQNTGNNQQPSNPYRRSDTVPDVAPISERCRRRLLCELQSEANYGQPQKGKRKHCYKIYCEDTQALWRLLHWLLTHHQSSAEDHRTRSIT